MPDLKNELTGNFCHEMHVDGEVEPQTTQSKQLFEATRLYKPNSLLCY